MDNSLWAVCHVWEVPQTCRFSLATMCVYIPYINKAKHTPMLIWCACTVVAFRLPRPALWLIVTACMLAAAFQLWIASQTWGKSTLERVSNPMYCCINSVFRKLCHDFARNIILRPSQVPYSGKYWRE